MKESEIGIVPSFELPEIVESVVQAEKRKKLKKTLAMYATMVAVSTCAIFLLEHATLAGAFRTALVAAVGKTFAANWVCSAFE